MDHRVKIEEREKIDKYLDLARELKKLWNMRVILIAVITFGTVSKNIEKNLGELKIKERIETTVLFKLAIILRKVLET